MIFCDDIGGKETNPLNDIPTEMITTAVTILQYITTNKATVTITGMYYTLYLQ